jgi:hypothetical protein
MKIIKEQEVREMSLKQKFLEAREYTLRNIHKIPPFPEKPKLERCIVREEIET